MVNRQLEAQYRLSNLSNYPRYVRIVSHLIYFVFRLLYRPCYHGLEYLPVNGGYIFAGNHVSLFDIPAMHAINPQPIKWLAKKELFSNRFTAKLFRDYEAIPLDREHASIDTMRQVSSVLQNNGVLGIFPQGTRVKEEEIAEIKPKAGVAAIALKRRAMIIPFSVPTKMRLGRKNHYYIGPAFSLFSPQRRPSPENMQELSDELLRNALNLRVSQ